MEAVSQELYEQVRAQVLEDLKAERRERAKKLEEERENIYNMFEPFRKKFYIRLVEKYESIRRFQTNLSSPERMIERWYEEVEDMALSKMRMNRKAVYRSGRVDEANAIAIEIMQTILRDKKEKET